MAMDKILRLVVDKELYQGFKDYCKSRHRTMSEVMREHISKTVFEFEREKNNAAKSKLPPSTPGVGSGFWQSTDYNVSSSPNSIIIK